VTRALLFGPTGQIGAELLAALPAIGEVVALARAECDLRDPQRVEASIAAARPDVIVNAAAYTEVDRAETEPGLAHAINAHAPRAMAAAAARTGALFVHYSTDYVFDGRARVPYAETDTPAPLNVYGRSKLAGEHAIAASGCAHLVLRTSWVYGLTGRNFLRTMLRLAAERDELRVVDDQIGAPTWSRDIARASVAAIGAWLDDPAARPRRQGIYHLTAAGSTSWFGFARAIFDLAPGLARRPRLVPIATADYPCAAARPAWSVLDGSRYAAEFDLALADWRERLRACLGVPAPTADGI
jgi:dTDP-4-dehydrorhamnose reductase